MSSKKITDADKLEIIALYRQSGDTTTSLASRYGVSSSTIGRILKMSIPLREYELLIQQKRGVRGVSEEDSSTAMEEDSSTAMADSSVDLPMEIPPVLASDAPIDLLDTNTDSVAIEPPIDPTSTVKDDLFTVRAIDSIEEQDSHKRRVRRRSSAPVTKAARQPISDPDPIESTITTPLEQLSLELALTNEDPLVVSAKNIIPPPLTRTPVLRDIISDSHDRYTKPPVPSETAPNEAEEDPDDEDVNALAAMFGEEIADGEDDDEDTEGEDWEEDSTDSYQELDRDRLLTGDRLHVQVTPLSQAVLPRTCYIVIDKFAELIVRPLKDFADLGQITSEEIQQRTLPIFDNPRVAKRFSNQRTQRVIKVPDSKIFHKTIHHLRSKGITCLLVDGNIYSLN